MSLWYIVPSIGQSDESDSFAGQYGTGKLRNDWADITFTAGDYAFGLGGETATLSDFIDVRAGQAGITIGSFGTGKHKLDGTGLDRCVLIEGADRCIVQDLEMVGSTFGVRYWTDNANTATGGILRRLSIHDLAFDNTFGAAIYVSAEDESAAATRDVVIDDIDVYNCPEHGISLYGYLRNITVKNSRIRNTSYSRGTHGLTCAAANANTSGTWTLVSGTIYKIAVPYTNIYGVTRATGSAINGYRLLIQNTGTPSSPAAGEYGVTGGELYVNFGVAITNEVLNYCHAMASGVLFFGNRISDITDADGNEGHGLAFDDYTSNSRAIGNVINNADGYGISLNRGSGCNLYGNVIVNSGRRAILSTSYGAHRICNNTILDSGAIDSALPIVDLAYRSINCVINNNILKSPRATYGILAQTGSTGTTASNNCIVGPTIGNTSGVTDSNIVTSDPILDADYRIGTDSPCYQAGIYTPDARDYAGRKLKRVPDIGARQYYEPRAAVSPARGLSSLRGVAATARAAHASGYRAL